MLNLGKRDNRDTRNKTSQENQQLRQLSRKGRMRNELQTNWKIRIQALICSGGWKVLRKKRFRRVSGILQGRPGMVVP
eukprot:767517-Hanusia_phi.AAC.4